MARCHMCNKYMGQGFFSKWVTMDGDCYCLSCAPQYAQQRKQQTVKDIMAEPSPRPAFIIHRMWPASPDGPRARARLLGAMVFLDRGICFVHLGSHLNNSGGAGLAFGALGALIAGAADRNKMLKELNRISDESPITEETLFERMADAEGVLFYPFSDMSKLSQHNNGFTIHFGKKRKRFAWDGGGQTRKQYGPLLEAYNEAIRTQTDPTMLCRAVR